MKPTAPRQRSTQNFSRPAYMEDISNFSRVAKRTITKTSSPPPPYTATQAAEKVILKTVTNDSSTTLPLRLHVCKLLGQNPGFCHGAWSFRRAYTRDLKVGFELPPRCTHCGIKWQTHYPISFIKHWPDQLKLTQISSYPGHVAAGHKNDPEKRGCIVCLEKGGKWVEPMMVEEW